MRWQGPQHARPKPVVETANPSVCRSATPAFVPTIACLPREALFTSSRAIAVNDTSQDQLLRVPYTGAEAATQIIDQSELARSAQAESPKRHSQLARLNIQTTIRAAQTPWPECRHAGLGM